MNQFFMEIPDFIKKLSWDAENILKAIRGLGFNKFTHKPIINKLLD